MKENIETLHQSEKTEREPYNAERIRAKMLEIQQQEQQQEPRKAPDQDLKPRDLIVLQKFGYKSRDEIKDWQ